MSDEKKKNEEFDGVIPFEDEEDGYESEKTVVDTELLKKLTEKFEEEDKAKKSKPATVPAPESVVEAEVIEDEDEEEDEAEDLSASLEAELEPTVQDSAPLFPDVPPPDFDESEPPALTDEKTVIISTDSVAESEELPPAKLVVIDGPASEIGKEYDINFNEIFIGRGVENDFVISDPAISRKHFRIRRHFDEYRLVDLGSGNGTLVNGVKSSECVLHTDDVITVGQTKIQFIDYAERQRLAKTQAEAPQPETAAAAAAAPTQTATPPKASEEPLEMKPEQAAEPPQPPQPPQQAPQAPAAPPEPTPTPEPPAPEPPAAPAQVEPQPEPEQAVSAKRQDVAMPQAPRWSKVAKKKKSSNTLLIAAGAVAAIAILAAILSALGVFGGSKEETKQKPKVAIQDNTKKQQPKQTEEDKKIAELLEKAAAALAKHDFERAIAQYQAILVFDPKNSKANEGLTKAKSEKENSKIIEEAKKLIAKKDYSSAEIQLGKIEEGSMFYDEAKKLMAQIMDGRYASKIKKAKRLLEKEQFDKAASIVDGILSESSDYEPAKELKDQILAKKEAKQAEIEAKKAEEEAKKAEEEAKRAAMEEAKRKAEEEARRKAEEQRKKRAAKKRSSKRKKAAIAKRTKRTDDYEDEDEEDDYEEEAPAPKRSSKRISKADINNALGTFKQGDASGAIAKLQSLVSAKGSKSLKRKAKKLLSNMKKFLSAFEDGMRAAKKKKADRAIKSLKKAEALNKKIAKGKSAYAKDIKKNLSKMYTLRGVESLRDEEYEDAFRNFKKALSYDSGNKRAKKGLEKLQKAAKKLYFEAYAIKSSDPKEAKRKLKTILKIVPSNNKWYKKAKKLLKSM